LAANTLRVLRPALKTVRSPVVLHRIAGDVKFWTGEWCPGVDEVRPGRCNRCGAAARCGERVVIQGHGVVMRQRLGPGACGGAPEAVLQAVRRYRCCACGHILRVTHRALLPYKHYGAGPMAEALGRWGVHRQPAKHVRKALSPWRPGAASTGWRSLARWARDAAAGRVWPSLSTSLGAPVRELADRAARVLASLASGVEGGLLVQLWEAAVLAR